MQKKLSASMIIFLSAIAVFAAWYSFPAIVMITIPVILLCEEENVKKNVLNAFFYALIFIVVNMVLGKLSSWYTGFLFKLWRWDWVAFFNDKWYDVTMKLDIAFYLMKILDFVKFVLMVVFVIIAIKGSEVKIPIANSLACKVLGLVAPKAEKAAKEDKKEEKKEEKAEEKEENPLTSDKATLTEIPKE